MSEPDEEVQTEKQHVSVQEMQDGRTFQVAGNDTSGYIGVSPEYRGYADDTHKPINTMSELQLLANAGIPTDDELVSRQVPGTAAGLVEVEDDDTDEDEDEDVKESEPESEESQQPAQSEESVEADPGFDDRVL